MVSGPRWPPGRPGPIRPRGKASFKPPSRIAAAESLDKDWADLPADPAGQALCNNMRELTAHLRGIYHERFSSEDLKDGGKEGHPLMALCDSMRELNAQLRGIFHMKSSDAHGMDADGVAALGAMKQRHPLVASLAESLHREALRMLEDEAFEPVKSGSTPQEAPPPTTPSGLSGPRLQLAPKLESGGAPCARQPSRSFCGRRTRPRSKPASPRDNARKRAASRESGPERLKRLGLVGIPKAEKMEVDPSCVRRPKADKCPTDKCPTDKRQSAAVTDRRRPTSERARSKKAGKSEAETRPHVSPEAVTTRLRPSPLIAADGKGNLTEDERRRAPQARPRQPQKQRPSVQRRSEEDQRSKPQRSISASVSRESGPERLQRLGLVGMPPRKEEAGQPGTRRLRAPEEEAVANAAHAGAGATPAVSRSAPKATHAARSKKAAEAASTAETERMSPGRRCIQESESISAMDEDVRRMLEWAAAEAAHTRRVATRVANFHVPEGAAHYSVARIRETNQGRLATRLRAATLNRARQARQAMQSMVGTAFHHQDELPFRTPGMPGMVEPGRQVFPWGLGDLHDEEPLHDESLDETLSQDEADEESASFLTTADRQRIGEVLAEQERRRGGQPSQPRTVGTMWPTFSPGRRPPEVPWSLETRDGDGPPDRHRPPSRGGESWQPLGQTTPPAYEQVTPELLQLWQIQDLPNQELPQDEAPELPPVVEGDRSGSHGPPEVHGDDGRREPTGTTSQPGGHEIPDAIEPDAVFAPVERRPSSSSAEERIESQRAAQVAQAAQARRPPPPEMMDEDVSIDPEVWPSEGGDRSEDRPSPHHASVEPASHSVEAVDEAVPEEIEVASVHSSEDFSGLEEVEVTENGGFHADEWIVEVSHGAQATETSSSVAPAVPASDAAVVQDITEEVVSVIMEELINDTIQSSTAPVPEPALWHPTPVAPPFIDIFNEDTAQADGSSAESEPVQPEPRRPLPQQSVPTSQAKQPAAAPADGDLSDAGRQSKDSGPPRPPSPPPDARSLATATAVPSFQTSSQGPILPVPHVNLSPPKVPKGKQEQADLISQELLEMLLGEALQDYQAEAGLFRKVHHVEEPRVSMGSAGPSPVIAGPKPIDTSEAVVGPFVDAAFKHFGVTDEAQPVAAPVPPVEEWLPAVLEIIKSKVTPEDAEALSPEEDSERAAAIEGFTRLLADALLEIASEEVKEQGPRVMGWRRPCFGEAPLSRFREKQAQEGQTSSQKQTWEKARAKLTELVRFGWRSEAAEETSTVAGAAVPSRMTIDLEAGAAGALALANLDEGIDALLEEEICSDEASWLDIKADVQKVKNEVARMIFADLVEELANEIARLWAAPYGSS